MTTESKQVTRPQGASLLLGAAAAALVVATVITVVGALASGSTAAYGALTGAGIALVVFMIGSFSVDAVARVMPSASLLVAMLTYTLQVVVMALVFVALSRSGLLDDTLDRRWLAAGVIAVTVTWLVGQVWLTARARIPVYDLPASPVSESAGERPEAGAR
ncbi:hypothetical protein [Nocardioides sp. InS609-2]|uniref:hypothetical protein n=1 Tax=Nocardioides sp. InS609-2 TaxID=2760705 RepID=UPI0020BEC0E3|nr:hypothetical protein [Nocardioides sp. InS609-2]